jgi:phenylalanyl-tRNA synthetase beta chain
MKISYHWLRQYLAIDLPAEDVSKRLTMLGLEVEGLHKHEQVKGSLAGVVVGRVLTCAQHPNADRLRVTTVDVGPAHNNGQPLNIVCGAPNVAAGQHVLVALVGTTIYPTTGEPVTLKATKIRGAESQGMICAEDELGLGQSHDGIMVLPGAPAPGTPAAEVLQLQTDWVFEIGITPNRADALSHFGVARDLAASMQLKALMPAIAPAPAGLPPCPVTVTVADEGKCARYSGLVITGINVQESPAWLKQRLEAIGQRPINNVVDATNFVLHELGQPLHAFDLAKIRNNEIQVRGVPTGTKFTTLDGTERTLEATDLLICDPAGPLCIAGVMGGLDSGVTNATTAIFLESAYFNGATLRSTSRRLQLFSDSSYRFERGTDPNLTLPALERAAALIMEMAGGTRTQSVDVRKRDFAPRAIAFNFDKARKLAGKHIGNEEMAHILRALEIEVGPIDAHGNATLHVPPYRVDVEAQQDVVEEILRVYGYNRIEESSKLNASIAFEPARDPLGLRQAVADYLAGAGFYEIWTNSLTRSAYALDDNPVRIANPLSEELDIMRQSLLHPGLEVVAYNLARKTAPGLRMFEMGSVYHHAAGGKDGFAEERRLALFICGEHAPEHWQHKPHASDFFTLKGEIAKLVHRLGLAGALKEQPLEPAPEFAFGVQLVHKKEILLRYGKVAADIQKAFDIKTPVYYADVAIQKLEKLMAGLQTEARELPRHPAVRRDLSMLVNRSTQFGALAEAIVACNPKLVQHVGAFDVYDKADAARKSYTISIILQDPDQTLTDAIVDKFMARAIERLEKDFAVEIRK